MIKNCPMRHENGNCIPAGGFCTANKNICEALHNAYRMGKAQLSSEGTTSDLISRTETVERLHEVIETTMPITPYDGGYIDGIEVGISIVTTMPTIQPQSTTGQLNDGAQSTAQSTNLIDRHQAIDAVDAIGHIATMPDGDKCIRRSAVKYTLSMLPTAQPETAKRIVGKSRDGMTLWYQCDMCNEPVDEQDNYCRGCGRRLIDG